MSITLRPYQTEIVDGTREALRRSQGVLINLATGGGKCLGENTPVLMFDGTTKMSQEIIVGDVLIGPDSRPRIVTSICSGIEQLYCVAPTKGDAYVVNESHILSLKKTRRYNNPIYKSQRHDESVINVNVKKFFESKATFRHLHKGWRCGVEWSSAPSLPIEPYFLGLWLGDGHSNGPKFTTGDREVVEYLESICGKYELKTTTTKNSENSVNINLRCASQNWRGTKNAITEYFKSDNLLRNKHIPHRYKIASRDDRLLLLAGIIDTDGHLHHNGYDVNLKSKKLAEDIIFVARSLGFAAYLAASKKTCSNNGVTGDYWRFNISGDVSQIPCLVERKKAQGRSQKKNHLVTGLSVQPIHIGKYYGFELSGPDRLFLLGDFTVTHNTQIAAFIAKGVSDRGKKIWFAAHRSELISQTALTFDRADIDYGFIAAGRRPQPYAPVQICSIQTLVNRLDRYRAPDILFIDEAKRTPAPTYAKIVRHCMAAGSKIIGLDATPWRINGAGFTDFYQDMVKGPPPSWLIANGWLSRYTAFSVPGVNRAALHTKMGEFVVEDAEKEMSKPGVTGDIIGHWVKHARGKRTIMFEVSVKESLAMCERFNTAGYRALHIDGDTEDSVRRDAARRLALGEIDILSNVDLLSDGYDLAAAAGVDVSIEAGIFARPTQSLALWFQQIGRVMRPKTEPAILLDHAGNIMAMKHMFGAGLPDEDFNWSLEPWDRKAAKKKAESGAKIDIRQCSECYHVHTPAPACPACGYVYPKNGRQVEQRDGELEAIDPALIQREKDLAAQFRKQEEERCNSLADFQEIGRARGYKPQWAFMRWKTSAARRRQKAKEAAE